MLDVPVNVEHGIILETSPRRIALRLAELDRGLAEN